MHLKECEELPDFFDITVYNRLTVKVDEAFSNLDKLTRSQHESQARRGCEIPFDINLAQAHIPVI
jgi:hypothetical protein